MVVAAFVAPFLAEATTRFVAAAAQLPEVRLAVITAEPADRLPPSLREHLAGHWRVDDALDPRQIAEATAALGRQLGTVERIVAALEQLQVPLAHVREALGIPGMDVETALNVRDKARMKSVLRAAGVPCARHQLVHGAAEAISFAEDVGFPLVAKPPAGAGAQATYRLDDPAALHSWLEGQPPRPDAPGLLEEFLVGEEHSFDSVTIDGRTGWASVADYLPPPLEVLRNPWMQWTVLMRRDVSGPEYAGIHEVGPAALRALGVRDALTHMEWFRRPDGSVAISEVAARPPGAQISSMLGYTHDIDFYRAWAELVVLGRFGARERRYAAGTAYLRGQGRGRVRAVHGVDELQRRLGHLVVESRLPKPGQPANASGYGGEGYVIVRDPDTEVVEDALRRIVSGIRVELVEAQ
jgi:phosphoribosylaminoimidazole carboxylase (NCAIR synthetase)